MPKGSDPQLELSPPVPGPDSPSQQMQMDAVVRLAALVRKKADLTRLECAMKQGKTEESLSKVGSCWEGPAALQLVGGCNSSLLLRAGFKGIGPGPGGTQDREL